MRLGPDASLFQQRVQEADISGNIDNPEGGFDGLVQVGIIAGDCNSNDHKTDPGSHS